MITFATQLITRKVYADQASRLNLCCLVLWIFAIVFPILYLVSIGNLSWQTTTYTSLTPTLTFKNYELSYTNNNGLTSYYTNLEGRTSIGNTSPNIIGGKVSNQRLPVSIQIRDSLITSISGILYFDVVLSGSVSNQFVGVVTLNLVTDSTSNFINTSSISYDIKIRSASALSQNYQANTQLDSPFSKAYSTMEENIIAMSANSLGLIQQNQVIRTTISSSTTTAAFPTIDVSLFVTKQRILISASLLSQMRQFFRHWIYVFIPVSWLVMFFLKKLVETRIYPSRTGYAEQKQKIL